MSGMEEKFLTGIGVSPGIARGRVVVEDGRFREPGVRGLEVGEVEAEVARFREVLEVTQEEVRELQERLAADVGEGAMIFDAHVLMLGDRAVSDEVEKEIRSRREGAESVYYRVVQKYIGSLRRLGDDYFQERIADFEDVGQRVVEKLRGESEDAGDLEQGQPHVLAAHDLTPSDTAAMDRALVLGFVTEVGGRTSHTAILARSLNIPAVVGLVGVCEELEAGAEVILDGYQGVVVVNPSAATSARYDLLEGEKAGLKQRLGELRHTKCRTRDGKEIILSANIEIEDELPLLETCGAEGIGLYRTEFLFLSGEALPTEDEQAAVYARVAKSAGPDGVIIRTFDLGGDKLYRRSEEQEPNPFLGWRGIRVSLSDEVMFKAQLRAILRASGEARIGVMFPLVSGLDELKRANATLAECMRELDVEGVSYDRSIEVGAMIEVPSAAITADLLAPHVDFFSIGTNDLIQYTIAVDRVNERVADLYEPCHPAVLRLLLGTVRAAKSNDIWAGVCGEMAGDVLYTPLMVGVGIDELSVGVGQLPAVKHAVQCLDSSECAAMVEELVNLPDGEEIAGRCLAMASACYSELLD